MSNFYAMHSHLLQGIEEIILQLKRLVGRKGQPFIRNICIFDLAWERSPFNHSTLSSLNGYLDTDTVARVLSSRVALLH